MPLGHIIISSHEGRWSLFLPVRARLFVRPLYRPFRPPSTVDAPATKRAQRFCERHSKKSQSSAENRRGIIAAAAAAVRRRTPSLTKPAEARLVADGSKTSAARQTWSLHLNGSIGNRSDECRAWGAGQGGTSNGVGRSKAWVCVGNRTRVLPRSSYLDQHAPVEPTYPPLRCQR